jgi:hypothetical protein
MQRRAGVAAIAMVAAILAIVVPVGVASGQSGETDSFNGLKDGGYLRLHFNDTSDPGTFTQGLAPDGAAMAGQTQNVSTAQNCGVTLGSPDLAVVTATGNNPTVVGAETSGTKFVGLGVKSKQSNGTNCGRVEPTSPANETLSVALGSALQLVGGSPAGSGLSVVAAELDIDGKGQAIVKAELYNGPSKVGFALLSTAATTGDSGPDATSGNNFAFPISALMPPCAGTAANPTPPAPGGVCGSFAAFTKITLSTSTLPSGTPSFALEGGRIGDPRSGVPGTPLAWDTLALRQKTADSVFKLQQSDGTLFCGDKVTEGTGSFTRGGNKDGSDCIVVGYDYSNRIATDNEIELLWDTVSQPSATFSLTQTWLPEDSTTLGPDGSPIPSKSTQVKWTDDIPGFITAPACTSPELPSQYGTLAAPGIDASATTISITLAGPVPHPLDDAFLLQIGHEVVSIPKNSGNVLNGVVTYTGVTRGAGDSEPAPHAQGAKVMTTPFPIIELPGFGFIVAKMCVSESSWVTTGLTGGNGLPQVQVTDTILAEGDMGGKR